MIILEPFTTNDIPLMLNWNFLEDELVQFGGTAFTYPLTEQQIVNFMKTKDAMYFKAIDPENNVVIGAGQIVLMDNNTAKLARIVVGDKESRGKGYGKRMMMSFVQYARKELLRENVMLNVFDWNEGAIKCYEKIGFTFADVPPSFFDLPNGKPWLSKQMNFTGSID